MLLFFSHPVLSNSLQPHWLKHARHPCLSPSPEDCPSSCLLHQWCHSAILSSDTLFSFCLQSFPPSETFPMSQLFASNDQNIGVSNLVRHPTNLIAFLILERSYSFLQLRVLSYLSNHFKLCHSVSSKILRNSLNCLWILCSHFMQSQFCVFLLSIHYLSKNKRINDLRKWKYYTYIFI